MMFRSRRTIPAVLLIGLASSALADNTPLKWEDSFTSRVSVLALIETLNADLLSHDSATLTLERWCADHRLAFPARITAERVRGADKPATTELRQLLGVSDAEPVHYRRVRLHCGGAVLSEADNWYVPSRLTPDMNDALDTTDAPFGRAVQALRFQRHTLSAKLLWSPLPEGWEMGVPIPATHGSLNTPPAILEHRAVLSLPDGTPFSVVVETYTSAILGFPRPATR